MSSLYTIVGAGAIGGTLAAHLHLAGAEVHLVDTDPEHVRAIRQNGLRVEMPHETLIANISISTPHDAPSQLGAVLLAVKSQATDTASSWIAPRLGADGWIASMQNGLNEKTIAKHAGEERTVASFVDLFADVVAPGVIKDGGSGAIALGEYRGGITERIRTLAEDLRHWGTPIVTENVNGFLWSKLGFGTMLAATALADHDMGELIHRHRTGMHALVRESLTVASAQGIKLESFDAFCPAAYLTDKAAADTATDALVAWLANQPKKRSGIWRDIAVRHRGTEVAAMWQPVVDTGASIGLPTPLTQWMISKIKLLETGSIPMNESHLDELDELSGAA